MRAGLGSTTPSPSLRTWSYEQEESYKKLEKRERRLGHNWWHHCLGQTILHYKQEQGGIQEDIVQKAVVQVVQNSLDEEMEAMEVEKEAEVKENETSDVDKFEGEDVDVE